MRRSGVVVGLGFVLAGICAASCTDATQAVLTISTLAACESGSGPDGLSVTDAVVYIGSSYSELTINEEAGNAVAQVSCAAMKDAQKPSTLVLVPKLRNEAFVRVVAGTKSVSAGGVSRTPADLCGPKTKGACIRATRQFNYVPHATVSLPIVLHPSCVGSSCSGEQTCVEGGVCRGAKCPEGVRDCQASVLISSNSDAGGPPVDASQPPPDATKDASVPFSWPLDAGEALFTCSGGSVAWLQMCFQGTNCYDPKSGSSVCETTNTCAPAFLQGCCDNKLRDCCLARGTFHPVDVTGLDANTRAKYCEVTPPLCFSAKGCEGGRCDEGPYKSGWGVCVE